MIELARQRIGGLLFVAFSLAYGWFARDIPSLPVDAVEAMSARTLPFVLAAVGTLLGVAMVLAPAPPDADLAGRSRRWGPVLALLVSVSMYAALLPWLGFLLATSAFLVAGFVLLGERRPWLLLLGSLPLVGLLWLVLSVGLGVYLAPGRLFGG